MSNPLQDKLLGYEVPPPEGVWNNIAAALNEEFSPTISEKLYQFEAAPPVDTWKSIETKLNTTVQERGKVIPFYTRYRRPLKYSGAVAIFAFLAVLTSLLISKKTESELPAQTVHSSTSKDSSKSSDQSDNKVTATEKTDVEHNIASASVTRRKERTGKSSASMAEEYLPQRAERNDIVSSSLSPDKYMIYSDGDGNAVRLPKKIFSAFACPIDDYACKQRLQELREKFAASAMTADFNGLLQILKSLQENQ
jgi:hypothetical protein